MNKLTLLLIAICTWLIANCVNAQKYYPFPTKNAIWSIMVSFDDMGEVDSLYTYGIIGDTTINSKNYHKVYKLRDSTLNIKNSIYYGALREDSLKRVYFKRDTCDNEVILYNFSKKVGDTINIPFGYSERCDFKIINHFQDSVISIDSTLLLNLKYRKEINLYYATSGWTEGIGDKYRGLFFPISMLCNGICNSDLICFIQNDTVLYKNSNFKNCFSLTGIKENKNLNVIIMNIFPDPATNTLNIELNSSNQQFNNSTILKIYNLQGQLQLDKQITKPKEQIDVSNLPQGLYILKFQSSTSLSITKFIKQ